MTDYMNGLSVTKEVNDSICTVKIGGKVDSTNATELQRNLEELLAEEVFEKLFVDLEELEYISSAGLRVMLALKKKYPSMKVINISRDVYEVFEITGFTGIMDMQKAYRRFSTDGLEFIGQGTCGKVYRLTDETIIKVFRPGYSVSKIVQEQSSAHTAFVNGVETAIPFDVVKVGEQFGVIYEILNADSLRGSIQKNMADFDKYAEMYAGFMKKMHHIRFKKGALPNIKDSWIPCIGYMGNFFDDEQKKAVKKMFMDIPDSDTFIHGDPNPGNMMVHNGNIILIDMADASIGHPIFDIIGIYLSFFMFAEMMPEEQVKQFTGFSSKENFRFWDVFCKAYFGIEDCEEKKAVEQEIRPYAAFRVLQATLAADVFSQSMVSMCRDIVLKAVESGCRLDLVNKGVL